MAISVLLATGALLGAGLLSAAEPPANNSDWPQWRGPNRDGIAVNSPKLLDSWPKEGPPVLWNSEWIPGFYSGGCGGPVVADGKVFVYVQWKQPVGGGNLYKLITTDVLANAGWLPDLPDELAKKIEAAWSSPNRPNSVGWPWWEMKDDNALNEFLAKKPELDKYIKDFLATLSTDEAKKFDAHIRRRLCINHVSNKWGNDPGFTWEELVTLSKMQDVGYPSLTKWAGELSKTTRRGHLTHHLGMSMFFEAVWKHGYTMASDTLVCLDAASGKMLWKKDFPLDADALAKIKQETGNWCNGPFIDAGEVLGVSSSPAVWNGKCYFTGARGLYCVSEKDGNLVWYVKRDPVHPSVLVADGVVYHCGSAYDAESGKLLWKNPLWKGIPAWQKGGDNSSALIWSQDGRSYVFASTGNAKESLSCLDLKTGENCWTLKNDEAEPVSVGIAGNVLVMVGLYRISPAKVEPLARLDGCPEGASLNCLGQILYQDHLYEYVTGTEIKPSKLTGLCCFDVKTGKMNWTDKSCGVPWLLADGKMIVIKRGKGDLDVWGSCQMDLVRATPENFISLGQFKPKICPWSNPVALAGGLMFVRSEDGVTCYDLRAK